MLERTAFGARWIAQVGAGKSHSVRAGAPPRGTCVPLCISLVLTILRWNIAAPSHPPAPAAAEQPVPVEVQTFESPFGKARTVIFSDGTPWFVAKDVCEGLGLKLPVGNHTNRLDSQQKCVIRQASVSSNSPCRVLFTGGVTSLSLISRGGFNDLVLESRKPVAREYRQWVTDEVLPALQDTGTFTDKGHPTCHPSMITIYCRKRPRSASLSEGKENGRCVYRDYSR